MDTIFEYTSYRAFLQDYYSYRKSQDEKFSFRIFGRAAGFSSSNFIKLLILGDKNAGPQSAVKLCQACQLNKKESEYFITLVQFDQAKTDTEKNEILTKISDIRIKRKISTIEQDQFSYYSDWYNPILRELFDGKPVDISHHEIAQTVDPPILPKQVKRSLALLLDIGMLEVVDGTYKQANRLIKTDSDITSLAVRNFHSTMSQLAERAIHHVDKEHRNITAVTGKVSHETYQKITGKVAKFRQELVQLIAEGEEADRVYHMNFQLFPLSKEE